MLVPKRETVKAFKEVENKVTHICWTIQNFGSKITSSSKRLESEKFKLDEDVNDQFELQLHCPKEAHDNIWLRLHHIFQEGNTCTMNIDCNFWIDSFGGKYHETEVRKHTFHYDDEGCDSCSIIKFDDFLTHEDLTKIDVFNNDCVVICGEVHVRVSEEDYIQPKINIESHRMFDLELPQKPWISYKQGSVEEIIIRAEDKELKVPKGYIVSNSDMLDRMLMTEKCEESRNIIVEINDTKYNVVKAFVKYMHYGETQNFPDICEELFALANKYRILQLQIDCTGEMARTLGKDNIFNRLKLAFMHNLQHLKEAVLNYITLPGSDCTFPQISMSPQWFEFAVKNMDLAQEITAACYARMNLFSSQTGNGSSTQKRQRKDDDGPAPQKRWRY